MVITKATFSIWICLVLNTCVDCESYNMSNAVALYFILSVPKFACMVPTYILILCAPILHPFYKVGMIFQLSSAYLTHQAQQNKRFTPLFQN